METRDMNYGLHESYTGMMRIPLKVTQNHSLTIPERFFYGVIMSECTLVDQCYNTNQEFADLAGVTARSVSVWIRSLIDAGYIGITKSEDRGLKVQLGRPGTIRVITPLVHDLATDEAVSMTRNYVGSAKTWGL